MLMAVSSRKSAESAKKRRRSDRDGRCEFDEKVAEIQQRHDQNGAANTLFSHA